MSMETLEILQFGEFQIDPASRTLKRQEEVVALNRRAFDVLLYMVRNPGRVLAKEEMLKNVWPDAFVDENSLVQSISVLRKALAEKPGGNGYILTVPGRGYQFTCPVRSLSAEIEQQDAKSDGASKTSSGDVFDQEHAIQMGIGTKHLGGGASQTKSYLRHPLRVVLVMILLLTGATVTAVLAWKHWHKIPPSPVVVIADLENTTGEPGLSRVLDSAVAADLKQSPYLNFLSPVHVQETLSQMQQKIDAPLTPVLAREVCLRNNAQVMLRGLVAKFGKRYLLTLDATDCVSGDALASSKTEAATADDIPAAIDAVADDTRRKLGESRASIHQFGTPLFSENTGSLEALRNYSNGVRLSLQGQYKNAIPLFQRATELDPKFAIAYADLAAAYRNIGDRSMEAGNLKKAYELRDSVNERDRLLIIARYQDSVTGNLDEGLRNYQTWINIYPRDTSAWTNMADLYIRLGQPESAIAPAKRSLELNPENAVGYVVLGRALMHAGQLEAAKVACSDAISKGLDGDDLHSLLMQVDFAMHDADGVKTQIDWGRNHSFATRTRLNEALLAAAEGRVRQGKELMEAISASYKQQGLGNLYIFYLAAGTRILAEMGHEQEARKYLDSMPLVPGMTDPIVAMAETGESTRAGEILQQELASHPDDTMWASLKGPQIRAAILLAQHKPEDAVEALRPALSYDLRELDTPFMRGTAYLDARRPADAEREFRKILDHPGIDPLSYLFPLAHLELARALAAEHKTIESLGEYEKFFDLWRYADPKEPFLERAHEEANVVKNLN